MHDISELAQAVASHMAKHGWQIGRCNSCGLWFLACPCRSDCGRAQCNGSNWRDVISVAASPKFPEDVWSAIRIHFEEDGYNAANRSDLANPSHRGTRFVGAGLQLFEDVIDKNLEPPLGPLFVPQPVIRLNYWSDVAVVHGTSTAFLNICSEQVRSSIPVFIRHLDTWMGVLRRLGIARSLVTVILSASRWRGGPFGGNCIIVEISGTEVGDAILIDEDRGESGLCPIVDFSFGLERLVSAVNATIPYYAFVGPLPDAACERNWRAIDRLRTATLMSLAGIQPSSAHHGRHLRRAVSDAVLQRSDIDMLAIVMHSYQYWAKFITPNRGIAECLATIQEEWSHARALNVFRTIAPHQRERVKALSDTAHDVCRRRMFTIGEFQRLIGCMNSAAGMTKGPP